MPQLVNNNDGRVHMNLRENSHCQNQQFSIFGNKTLNNSPILTKVHTHLSHHIPHGN